MPRLQVGNVSTYYQQIGQGPVLVLLHGWGHTWQTWAPLIPALSEEYQLLLPNLPGFGESRLDENMGWTTPQYADWLSAFLSKLEVRPWGCIGHSYGGKLLLEYCTSLRQPQPQKKLVIIAPSGVRLPLARRARFLQTATSFVPSALKEKLPRNLRRLFYERVVRETDYLHADPFQQATLRKILQEDYLNQVEHLQPAPLLLGGRLDNAILPQAMELLAARIPQAKLIFAEHSGHFPYIDETAFTLDLIRKYLHASA